MLEGNQVRRVGELVAYLACNCEAATRDVVDQFKRDASVIFAASEFNGP